MADATQQQPQSQQGTGQEQYNLVYSLGVQPGIKRDGTPFEAREYSDGVWCRFQRGTPKKWVVFAKCFPRSVALYVVWSLMPIMVLTMCSLG